MEMCKSHKNLAVLVTVTIVPFLAKDVDAHDFYAGGTKQSTVSWTTWSCNDKCQPTDCPSQCGGALHVHVNASESKSSSASGSAEATFSGDTSIGFKAPIWKIVTNGEISVASGWTGSWSAGWSKSKSFIIKVSYDFTGKECIRVATRYKSEKENAYETIRTHTFLGNDGHCDGTTPKIIGHAGQHVREYDEWVAYAIESKTASCKWNYCGQRPPDQITLLQSSSADPNPYTCP